jgi:hypothetical protein
MQRSVKEHQAVCQAILDANGDAGRNEMLEHISIDGKDSHEALDPTWLTMSPD